MSNLRESVRVALVAKVEALKATFTAYPLAIEYVNGQAVNTATQSNPYLKVHLTYQDGQQIDLGRNPDYRMIGTIVLEACVKEGTGTRQANELLEHFYPALHMKDTIPPLRTLAARFTSRPARQGWSAEAALIPFWADSIGH